MRAHTCIAAQGRTSHGLLAWPSQVIDSESVSRSCDPHSHAKPHRRPMRGVAMAREIEFPHPQSIDSSLIGAHSAH